MRCARRIHSAIEIACTKICEWGAEQFRSTEEPFADNIESRSESAGYSGVGS